MLKKIAVMTSGGDSPGMNAAIRSVVRVALHEGAEVWGIYNGYAGMLAGDMEQLTSRSVGDIIQRGGTFLGTARCEEFHTEAGQRKAIENVRQQGIEGLVVIGGNGSLTGAMKLAEMGLPVVGLPGSIDNDIWGTDYSIGFDTAINTVVDAINKLRDTASAHRRVIVVEVMGRKSGWIAMTTGLAGGAEHILIPEMEYDLQDICKQLVASRDSGKKYSIIVVAEGAGSAMEIGKVIAEETNFETRVSILGHIQRGGSPTAMDRLLASALAEKAVLALLQGLSNIMFGYRTGTICSVSLKDAVTCQKTIEPSLFRLSTVLS